MEVVSAYQRGIRMNLQGVFGTESYLVSVWPADIGGDEKRVRNGTTATSESNLWEQQENKQTSQNEIQKEDKTG